MRQALPAQRCLLLFIALLLSVPLPAAESPAGGTPSTPPVTATRYELDVRPDFAGERLAAEVRLTVRNHSPAPVLEVPLVLYRLLRVETVTSSTGRPLSFAQQVRAFDDLDRLQANVVRVELPALLQPGGEATLVVRYSGYLFGYVETGMRYVREHISREFTLLRDDSFAYPVVGYPSMQSQRAVEKEGFDYVARVTVPAGLTVANGGRLLSREDRGDEVTFTYANMRPAWRIDLAIAPFEVLAVPGLTVFHLPGDESGARAVADGFARASTLFTEWFGPRTGTGDFAVIETPEGYGGQADVTSILQPRDAFIDPDQRSQLYHEVSHLWNVESTERPSPRLEEGLATYLEWRAFDVLEGEDRYEPVLAWLTDATRETLANDSQAVVIAPADYGRAGRQDLSYSVGMIFFAILEKLVGEAELHRLLAGFYQEHGDRGASVRELADHLTRESRVPVGPFVEAALFETELVRAVAAGKSVEEIAASYAAR